MKNKYKIGQMVFTNLDLVEIVGIKRNFTGHILNVYNGVNNYEIKESEVIEVVK